MFRVITPTALGVCVGNMKVVSDIHTGNENADVWTDERANAVTPCPHFVGRRIKTFDIVNIVI